jgi:glycosyltransferase involved in cell wall biosynthesis
MEKLTIVTPTLPERGARLGVAHQSVLNQTLPVHEHLIRLDSERRGPAEIRNALVDLVETEWVLFLDDDDWLDTDYVEAVMDHLTDKNDVVYTWCHRIGFEDNLDKPFNARSLRKANFIPVTACVKVETFRKVGGFPLDVAYEDWGLWIKILDAGGRFRLVPKKKWTYERHKESRTHSNQKSIAQGKVRAV